MNRDNSPTRLATEKRSFPAVSVGRTFNRAQRRERIMSSVWIVSEGEYSDWRILGVYSSRELATEAKIRCGTANEIDEHVVDALPSRPDGEYRWLFSFDNDGNVTNWQTGCDFKCRRGGTSYGHGMLDVYAVGETFEDAFKSATDTRRMLLAMTPQPQKYQMVEFE